MKEEIKRDILLMGLLFGAFIVGAERVEDKFDRPDTSYGTTDGVVIGAGWNNMESTALRERGRPRGFDQIQNTL